MRIAQIAPLCESVPPSLYGGTERIVSYLTEELVALGHQVTLFASGDSRTSAELVACSEMALRLSPAVEDYLPHHVILLERIRRCADEFDVIHFHIDLIQFPLIRALGGRALTTLHGRQDLPDLRPFFAAFPDVPLVSISNDQRRPLPCVNWLGTVYHGLPPGLLRLNERPRGGYLAFLGRISPEKGPVEAIEIARRAGRRLRIAAKIDRADRAYWESTVRPLVDGNPQVEFVGEITDSQKQAFLGEADALLFPINWPEPFGIVLIEAMACGTPVIAFRSGSVPEVVDDGRSGLVVASVDEAVAALGRLDRLDRRGVRQCFEQRFTAGRMARDYLQLYRRLAPAEEPAYGLPGGIDRPDETAPVLS